MMKKMDARDRIAAVRNGGKIDRLPVNGFIGGYAAKLAGIPLKDYYTNMDECIRVQLLTRELHGYDDGPGYGWADWGGWEFGSRIHMPENYLETAPQVEIPVVNNPEDVEKLQIPDPATAGMYVHLNEFNRKVRKLGQKAKIQSGSVTNVVAGIIGKEKLLRWYHKQLDIVHLAYQKAVQFILKAADYTIAEFGVENCGAGSSYPLDANDLISRDLFEKFIFKYQSIVNGELMARGLKNFGVHICGDHNLNLDLWAKIPLPPRSTLCISSQLDIAKTAAAFNHQHIIAGNVATQLLNNGTYEEVYAASVKCIEIGKKLPGGFVLMPACEMPVSAPPLNVHALVAAAIDCSD